MSQLSAVTAYSHQPVIIIIFGITGDLSQRKLLPAIYHLYKSGWLHEDSVILGVSRRSITAEELLGQVELCVNEVDNVCDPVALARVQKSLRMQQMTLTDGAEYDQLLTMINDIETEKGICMDRLYNLSIPPQMFGTIVQNLGQHGHNASCRHGVAAARLLVEKPFGHDLASAKSLIQETDRWYNEDQQYRIDHYVAKPTVLDMVDYRSSEPGLDAVWNAENIESITITAYEKLTIEGRAAFYEGVGALRDFVQNHLLQILALLTMDLPAADQPGSAAVHASKQRLLAVVKPIAADKVSQLTVRGQYQGYREAVNVPDSITETYAELKLQIENPRWQGVPIRLRTGKAMAEKRTDVRIVFKPTSAYHPAGGSHELVFDLQAPSSKQHPEAYERVLIDAARGDHTLFISSQEVLASWRIVDNVLRVWGASGEGLIYYAQGSKTVTPD